MLLMLAEIGCYWEKIDILGDVYVRL